MEKNEKMKGFLGEWLEKSGKVTEVFRVERSTAIGHRKTSDLTPHPSAIAGW